MNSYLSQHLFENSFCYDLINYKILIFGRSQWEVFFAIGAPKKKA